MSLYHTAQEIQKMSLGEFIRESNYLVDTIKTRAKKGSPHFFDPSTMRFFSSRILDDCWKLKTSEDIYFITSEADNGATRHAGSVRAYTVRKCDKVGDIETVSKFQGIETIRKAKEEIKKILGVVQE